MDMINKLGLLLVLCTLIYPGSFDDQQQPQHQQQPHQDRRKHKHHNSHNNYNHRKHEPSTFTHNLPHNDFLTSKHRSRNTFDSRTDGRSDGSTSVNCSIPERERKTFLWRIGTSPPSYMFGTIHVPYTRVWDYVAKNTIKAFMSSDKIYFELDLTNPYTISALTSCQLLPRRLNLSQVLPPGVYGRLEDQLNWARDQMSSWVTEDQEGRGLYSDYLFNAITGNWERKRPIWAMLMVNGLTPSDIASRGFPVLDLYLAQLADQHNKEKGAVERVEEQCVPLNGLTYGQVVFALNQTLQQHENIRNGKAKPQYTTDDLIRSYQCGNMDSFKVFNSKQVPLLTSNSPLSIEEEKISNEINQYFREHLIYRRNRRMGARVVELLLNNPGNSYFFVFGAGHFVGNSSVIQVVKKAGFTVEEVGVDDDLSRWAGQAGYTGSKPPRSGTVAGTFEDLSEEERTKAFLQFLEHRLQMEKEEREPNDDGFHELWQRLPTPEVSSDSVNTEDVESVRDSIKVWYGLSSGWRLEINLSLLPLLLLALLS